MVLTKEQLSELICKHSERENGLQDLLEILLESMMVSERRNISGKTPHRGINATASVRDIVTVMAVR